MPAEPIQRSNLVDGAYAAIKQMILGGQLAPGARLVIGDLVKRLCVSNSPIREALRRLENEHWVETVPFRGSFVTKLDEKELVDLYEIRELIEVSAVVKMMPNPPARQVKALEAAQKDIDSALQAGDALAYLLADARFHQAIVDMAGNDRLSRLFATLVEQGRCFMLGRTPQAMAANRDEPEQHGEMLTAIRAGDGDGAVRLLAMHLRDSLKAIHAAATGGE